MAGRYDLTLSGNRTRHPNRMILPVARRKRLMADEAPRDSSRPRCADTRVSKADRPEGRVSRSRCRLHRRRSRRRKSPGWGDGPCDGGAYDHPRSRSALADRRGHREERTSTCLGHADRPQDSSRRSSARRCSPGAAEAEVGACRTRSNAQPASHPAVDVATLVPADNDGDQDRVDDPDRDEPTGVELRKRHAVGLDRGRRDPARDRPCDRGLGSRAARWFPQDVERTGAPGNRPGNGAT